MGGSACRGARAHGLGGWYFLKSSTNFTTSGGVIWGVGTDVAVPGDFDGDGKIDPAVFRPSTGGWYFLKSSTNFTTSFGVVWGVSTDTPINRRPCSARRSTSGSLAFPRGLGTTTSSLCPGRSPVCPHRAESPARYLPGSTYAATAVCVARSLEWGSCCTPIPV